MAVPLIPSQDCVIGAGILMISEDNTKFRDLGETNAFSITSEITNVEVFSSRKGSKKKIKDIVTQIEYTATITLITPDVRNLQHFFLGESISENNQVSGNVSAADHTVFHDYWIDLPDCEIANVVVEDSSQTTTYVEGTDYEILEGAGMIRALSGGAISDGETVKVSYDKAQVDKFSVEGATVSKVERYLLFRGDPTTGKKQDVLAFASVRPNGELPMIGDAVQEFQFTAEFLQNDNVSSKGLLKYTERGAI